MWLIQVAQVLLSMWLGFKKNTILNFKGVEYLNRIFQMQNHTWQYCFLTTFTTCLCIYFLFLSFFLSLFPSFPLSLFPSLLPSFARGRCSCAVSSCQTLFCFTPLAPSSLTHPISISMFFPFFQIHPSLCFSSSHSISFICLLPFLLKAIWAFHLSPTPSPSLSLLSSLPYSTYLSFTFTRCQHFLLLPLLLLHLSPFSRISTPCLWIILFPMQPSLALSW